MLQLDPNNPVINRCIRGMEKEGLGDSEGALQLFTEAWNEAANAFEKFVAAHYVARHQQTYKGKLHWDITALTYAKQIEDEKIKAMYPSLYLNIAKGYEDLNDQHNAEEHYRVALSFTDFLPDNGYGNMIRGGIATGLSRTSRRKQG